MANINEKKIIQNNLNEAYRFSKMLSKTVHDINNPLAVLIGQLSIVDILKQRDQFTEEKQAIILEKLNSSAKLFKERLDDLRGFYKVLLNDESFSQLGQILHCIHYYFEPELYEHSIKLDIDCDAESETKLKSAEVFYFIKNLIQNSIENIVDSKTQDGTVKLKCFTQEGSIHVKVSDNGPELIAPLGTVLELGHTTKNEVVHPGIGLNIAQNILDSVKSELSYTRIDSMNHFSCLIPKK